VPYTGAGKQAISDEEEVTAEIKNTVMEVARRMQHYLHEIIKEKDRAGRRKVVERYLKQLSIDLADLAEKGKASELEEKMKKLIENKYPSLMGEGDEEGENGNGGNGKGEKEER
ncbi:hypothetical protein COV61_05705, partial [Candidatus Micrarchaeota archaeon CG11_big_fil_rev_8_21_14_0_20_47_5]